MKKFLLFALIGFFTFFCTGCVKFSYDIQIDDKDNVYISETKNVTYAPLKADTFRYSIRNELKKIFAKYITYGYDVKENFDNSDSASVTISRNKLSYYDAAKNLPKGFKNNDIKSFSIENGLFKKVYKIHLIYDFDNALEEATLEFENFKSKSKTFKNYKESLDNVVISKSKTVDSSGNIFVATKYANGNVVLGQYNPYVDKDIKDEMPPQASLTIKIPTKATKHNASKIINDNEYQWDLISGKQDIIIEYEKLDFSILAVIFSLIVAGIAVITLSQKLHREDPVQGL